MNGETVIFQKIVNKGGGHDSQHHNGDLLARKEHLHLEQERDLIVGGKIHSRTGMIFFLASPLVRESDLLPVEEGEDLDKAAILFLSNFLL